MAHFIRPAAFVLLVTIMGCKQKEDTPTGLSTGVPSNVFYVQTAPVTEATLNDHVHVTGIIQSDTEARPSFKTGGVIDRIYVDEGDRVHKGQLLARLNMTEIEAQATQARVALDKALRDQQRIENLHRDSIATLDQLQNSTSAVEMAQKNVQIAEFNVAYSEVRSPIDGKVITRLLHEGEVTGPGMPVVYIMGVHSSDWKVVAGLTDKNWGRLKAGDLATITLDAYPGWTTQGRIRRLADVSNPLSGTFDVDIAIPSGDKRIAAGMLAHVEITPARAVGYPVIPVEALVSSNGRTGIVYVPRNGKAEKKVVQIQAFHGERISILSGLEDEVEVITAGSGFLEDGDSIEIRNIE